MSDTIFIRGREYEIKEFSDLHLSTINNLLSDLGDLDCQSDAGFVLSEIILPDIPTDLIRPLATGKYIVLLNAKEINDVVIGIMKSYYSRQLKQAEESGDKEYESQIRANMTELQLSTTLTNKSDRKEDELATLRAEVARLKASESK